MPEILQQRRAPSVPGVNPFEQEIRHEVYDAHILDTGARLHRRPAANAYDIGRMIAIETAHTQHDVLQASLTRAMAMPEFMVRRHLVYDPPRTLYGLPQAATTFNNVVHFEREAARPDPVDDHRIRYFWFVRADDWGRIALYPPGHIHNTDPYEWTSIYPIPDDAIEGDLNGPWPVDNSTFNPQQ